MHLTWQPGDPVIQINFNFPLNVSVQVGDIAYFSNPYDVGVAKTYQSTQTPHKTNTQSQIKMIGEIIALASTDNPLATSNFIQCRMPQDLFNLYYGACTSGYCLVQPRFLSNKSKGSFIMFSKDNKANMSSILGYYASAQFRNSSWEEAELFNVGVDIFESSK